MDHYRRYAYEADGKHEHGKAEEDAENDLLLKPDIDFPKDADRNCDDYKEASAFRKILNERLFHEMRRSVSISKALATSVTMIVLLMP